MWWIEQSYLYKDMTDTLNSIIKVLVKREHDELNILFAKFSLYYLLIHYRAYIEGKQEVWWHYSFESGSWGSWKGHIWSGRGHWGKSSEVIRGSRGLGRGRLIGFGGKMQHDILVTKLRFLEGGALQLMYGVWQNSRIWGRWEEVLSGESV